MNIQEYISSGIVESYVLGLASADEQNEFEQMCNTHPLVLQARKDFELLLEKHAFDNAIKPDATIKQQVIEKIQPAKIINLEPELSSVPTKKMNWWKVAAAILLLALAGSMYYNIHLGNKNKDIQRNYDNTLTKLNSIEKDIAVLQQNGNVKMAALKGMEASPKSLATVYWDTASHDVYLLVNNLPKPPSDKQYQLWAFLDGKPIDMGLIDNNYFINENKLLIKGKNAQNAQAFAITLEQKDRKDVSVPAGQVYVLGNL